MFRPSVSVGSCRTIRSRFTSCRLMLLLFTIGIVVPLGPGRRAVTQQGLLAFSDLGCRGAPSRARRFRAWRIYAGFHV